MKHFEGAQNCSDSSNRKEVEPKSQPNRHVSSPNKVRRNTRPLLSKSKPPSKSKPVSTTDKQSMAYVTIRNIESETSYLEKDWSFFALKELQDNAYDWLNDNYQARSPKDKENRKIAVRIWITTEGINSRFVHIAVRNSNVHNKLVFEDLTETFDFSAWHSTKRNQHRMTCGGLGDALKRCLGMGYASWTSKDNPDETFEDKQWNEPVIIRCNGLEFKAFIKVDTSRQQISSEIQQEGKLARDIGNDTEAEVTLPLPNQPFEADGYWMTELERYYKIYKIGKSRTDFNLSQTKEETK